MKHTKYVIVLGDGMSDLVSLTDTPLARAKKPAMDSLASKGVVGLCRTIPEGVSPGSDAANMSILGYDPRKYYCGRSSLEALSLGIKLSAGDKTYRANLVTLSEDRAYEDKNILDYSGGEISTEDARVLIEYLKQNLDLSGMELHAGVMYRHCLVRRQMRVAHLAMDNGQWTVKDVRENSQQQLSTVNCQLSTVFTPPHEITGRFIKDYLPKGEFADRALDLMAKSFDLLNKHPLNIARKENGLPPANSLWLWGEGTAPRFYDFAEKYGKTGAVVSAVDIIKGLGLAAGLDAVDVPGATGTLDTNYRGKVAAVMAALQKHDFAFIHVEAPDECGHRRDAALKTKAIELLDSEVVAPLVEKLNKSDCRWRMLITPDHATPISTGGHSSDPVPYILYDSAVDTKRGGGYCEKCAVAGGTLSDTPLIQRLFED